MIILVSPSCGGKDYLARKLVEESFFDRVISTTTRPQREHEVDGRDYWFVTKEQFEVMINKDQMLEHNGFLGNYYGKQFADLDRVRSKGCYPINIMEPEGAHNLSEYMRRRGEEVYTVFLQTDMPTVNHRFADRFAKDWEKLDKPQAETIAYYAERLASSFFEEQTWARDYDWDYLVPTLRTPEETQAWMSNITAIAQHPPAVGTPKAYCDNKSELPAAKYREAYRASVERMLEAECSRMGSDSDLNNLINAVKSGLMKEQARTISLSKTSTYGITS